MPEENRGPWSKKFENRWAIGLHAASITVSVVVYSIIVVLFIISFLICVRVIL